MQIEQFKSADGRNLMRALFTPPDPDPNRTPVYEVIFTLKRSGKTHLLALLSATRDDTREAVALTEEQQEAILEAAVSFLAEQDDGPMWEGES